MQLSAVTAAGMGDWHEWLLRRSRHARAERLAISQQPSGL
jgi:hypothetical protein